MLKALKRLLGRPWKAESRRSRLSFPANSFSDIFAIGDVHGCLAELIDAEDRIRALAEPAAHKKLIVMVGDYVDRGPNSAGVLDHLLSAPPHGFDRVCLCGNHDDAFYQFVIATRFEREWLDFGGEATLRSYGVDAPYHLKSDPRGASLREASLSQIPDDHIEFLRDAPIALTVGQFVFVHAGVVPGVPLEDQTDTDLMWVREPFLTEGPMTNIIVVHGHTPTENIVFGNRRIGLDTGAYMTGRLDVLRINRDGFSTV